MLMRLECKPTSWDLLQLLYNLYKARLVEGKILVLLAALSYPGNIMLIY